MPSSPLPSGRRLPACAFADIGEPYAVFQAPGGARYDGGAFFEGGLLAWDYASGKTQSLLADNREVLACDFEDDGRRLTFTVAPSDDLEDRPLFRQRHSLAFPVDAPLVLDDLPGTRLPFDWALYPTSTQREAALPILENLALGKDRRFLHRPPVWDLCFLDGQRLAIARASPRLELWNLADDSLRSFELAERGQCLQVFHNATDDSLLVNLQLGYAAQRLFKVPLTPGQPLLLSDCRHLLAQSAQGGFLARQIALEGKDLEDLVLDPAGRIVHRRRLGHYDLFNHHLRIDRGEAFFYLAGNPPEQHQDKGLFRLDPQTFKTREVLRLERHPEHFNNLHGCLLGNRLLLNAKVYNSPHHAYGTQRLSCYDLESRGTLWGATLSAQVSAFAPLPGGQWIALALVDGQVEVRDLASGECRWRYRTADAIPLCLAVSDKLLAIGFSHGGVSLLQVAADGQLIGPPGANPRQ
ncbi:peptide ABC transporter ATP-binding protein [Pseudomonas aeruginosa]|uniref:peptide ABC transporter ATP-binding protein n=1 Tax=Pseudomonas aeruginosa TaxID=287 RepID=UPI001043D47F|nr:peptide ABC transporter ATP-binding protein [Pseudomonas aeruginosa]